MRTMNGKTNGQRILSLALALLCLLSMGGGALAEQPSGNSGNYYAASFQDVDLSDTNVSYLTLIGSTKDGFYATGSELVGKNIPEGAVEEYEGQYDVYEQRLIFIDRSGRAVKLNYAPPFLKMEAREGQYAFEYSTWAQGTQLLPGGGFAEIVSCSSNWSRHDGVSRNDDAFWEEDNYAWAQNYYLRILNPDGSEASLTSLPLNEDDYIGSFACDREGDILFVTGTRVFICPAAGGQPRSVEVGEYLENVVCLPDGRIYVSSWGENGMSLYPFNKASGTLGAPAQKPQNAYWMYPGNGKYPLYYSSDCNFFGFDPKTGKQEKLFNWLNIDVSRDMSTPVFVEEDDSISGMIDLTEMQQVDVPADGIPQYQLFTVRRVPVDPNGQKTVLTFAGQGIDYERRSQIMQFNRSSDQVHIDVLDYSEYNTDDDYSAGLNALLADILAGNVPDIIDLENLPVGRLAAKGVLEDLYPWIDADPELSREDFFPNVLAAYEKNGRLVTTVSTFHISSLMGASAVVGDGPGWTYQQFDAALGQMPAGSRILSAYTTRSEVLPECLGMDIGNYVNWETGECRFDSRDFIDLLNFVSRFPAYFNWENYNYETDSDEVWIASGKQMLAPAGVYTIDDMMFNGQYFKGQSYSCVGYPVNSGTGNCFGYTGRLAMSAASAHKDLVWQFLRTYFTEEYQSAQFSIPSNRAAFEKKLQEAMQVRYRMSTDGEYIRDTNGAMIPEVRFTMQDGMGDYYDVYSLSQEDAEKLRELVATTTRMREYDEDIRNITSIVQEQAEAFFQGAKSAEATAKMIQSMVSIYVSERR